MTRTLTGLLAVAIVAAVVFGGVLVGVKNGNARAGMMAEVVSTAEMPRLVMPIVEVRAFQAVAVSVSEYNAN